MRALERIRRRQPEDEQETPGRPGRWILMPRAEEPFVGRRSRSRVRARGRRRRVLAVLVESIAFSVLIGAFPPLRGMWVVTGILGALLAGYLMLLARFRLAVAPPRRGVTLPPTDITVIRVRQAESRELLRSSAR